MGGNRQANLRAIVTSEIAELPASALNRIVETHPQAWRYFGMNVVQNSHITISVAGSLMIRPAKPRVASLLIALSQSGFIDEPQRLPIHLPQLELARLCALSRQVLSGVLRSFDERGFTRTSYRMIEVTDIAGLSGVATSS